MGGTAGPCPALLACALGGEVGCLRLGRGGLGATPVLIAPTCRTLALAFAPLPAPCSADSFLFLYNPRVMGPWGSWVQLVQVPERTCGSTLPAPSYGAVFVGAAPTLTPDAPLPSPVCFSRQNMAAEGGRNEMKLFGKW
jgi:hypothetical protein